MKLRVFIFLIISLFYSNEGLSFNDTIRQSHQMVMDIEYPNKKAVFMKFGTPTNTSRFENIENWYYKIGEHTTTTSRSLNFGFGSIQHPMMNDYWKSPYHHPQSDFISSSLDIGSSNSSTQETYIRFWFMNDTVIKWESLGVDFSRNVIKPSTPFAGEYLFFDFENQLMIHSHISILRKVSTGINGPMSLIDVHEFIENHPDFSRTFLPTITDLEFLYNTNSELSKTLKRTGLTVWSDTQDSYGKQFGFNFKTGEIIKLDQKMKAYFVPLVALIR